VCEDKGKPTRGLVLAAETVGGWVVVVMVKEESEVSRKRSAA